MATKGHAHDAHKRHSKHEEHERREAHRHKVPGYVLREQAETARVAALKAMSDKEKH